MMSIITSTMSDIDWDMMNSTQLPELNTTEWIFAESSLNARAVNVTVKAMMKGTPLLKKVHDWLISALLISVMFAMGCSITWEQVLSHLRKPVGILTGMLSQFILLPLLGYLLVYFLNIAPLHAAGLLILASSPGGVTSNLFTYFCDGDVSLRQVFVNNCFSMI